MLLMQASADFQSARLEHSSLVLPTADIPCEAIKDFKNCPHMSGMIESIPDTPGSLRLVRKPVTSIDELILMILLNMSSMSVKDVHLALTYAKTFTDPYDPSDHLTPVISFLNVAASHGLSINKILFPLQYVDDM